MHPQTHLALSWALGHRFSDRRDRVLVAWAGVAPDLDGLTIVAGLEAYGRWHHVLTHGVVAAVIISVGVGLVARRRLRTAAFAAVAFHLHLVCDLLGSGVQWPIMYFYPFTDSLLHTPYGWELASWQNAVATLGAVGFSAWVGVRYGRTFVESVAPASVDRILVNMLRRWTRRGA